MRPHTSRIVPRCPRCYPCTGLPQALRQLFHTLDPAPFRDLDLDEAAANDLVVACLGLRQWLLVTAVTGNPAVIGEGLLILGWVALWRPTSAGLLLCGHEGAHARLPGEPRRAAVI
jgi:hypothetical protein